MLYQEKKTKEGYDYFCEDLFGKAWIKSVKRLKGDILDEIVVDLIMKKKIKKGHAEGIEFIAEFKNPWEEIKEEDNKINNKTMKNQKSKIITKDQKSKILAVILALFLGGFGIHKMYLDKQGIGVVYLLFFWTGIPAILALIDAIILVFMSDKDFNIKYNGGKK